MAKSKNVSENILSEATSSLDSIGRDEAWSVNMKAGFDEMQNHMKEVNAISVQALQNAVSLAHKIQQNSAETDNMVAKAAIGTRGFTVDQMLENQTFRDIIAAAAAAGAAAAKK